MKIFGFKAEFKLNILYIFAISIIYIGLTLATDGARTPVYVVF
jgi:hypothetical protein